MLEMAGKMNDNVMGFIGLQHLEVPVVDLDVV